MYEIGEVYIWQNQEGEYAFLNGTETTVIGPPTAYFGLEARRMLVGQATDTPAPPGSDYITFAQEGDLRRKEPPATGEQMIRNLFVVVPEMMPA